MALASMLTSAFGVMLEPIEQELGWSRAQISSGPAIVSMMGLFLATPAGFLIDKLGARATGLFVIAISFASIFAISQVGGELWHWWAAWAIFGIAGAFTSTVWLAPVSTIFDKGKGLAIALTMAGTGISMALVPPLAEYFVQNGGWRLGYLTLGAIWCGVTLALVFLFVPSLRARPKGGGETQPAAKLLTGYSPKEGLLSRDFYILFLASLTSAMTGVAIILNLVPVLTFTGISRIGAVGIAGSMGIASIIGRLVGGWLMDLYDVRKLAIGASFVSVLFPLMLVAFPGELWAATVAVIAYGLTGGMKFNAVVYLCSTHLGARSFGLFYGAISTTTTIAMGIGPLIANFIYDTTQSYWPVIWAAVPGFLLTGVLFWMLGKAPDFGPREAQAI
jgi:MFS family permease